MPENDVPISKTQAIRDYLAEHPDASPRAVGEALVAQGFQISAAFVSAVQARLESANRSDDSVNDLLVTLGKAQVDAMFRRQDDYPVDDSEFLPLVEAALNAFEMAGIDEDEPPSAEDAADIMTRAMELSHPKVSCRPKMVFLRDNPTWEATFPWLEQLGIETVVTEDLLHGDAKAEELMEWMKKHWSPMPELMTKIHEELGLFGTLFDLRTLAYRFLYFEQPKER